MHLGLDIIYAQLHIQDASCLIKPIRDAWYVFKTQSVSIKQCALKAQKRKNIQNVDKIKQT